MSSIAGRRIVLGVSGGIAAYKAIEVCRRLVDGGAHVIPILTQPATRFVGEITFSALASEPAKTSLFTDSDPIPHTTLGQTADAIVVCPATARLIGAYAAGISDDLLTATLLATRAPVVICPAMHTEMWEHAAVADNLEKLRSRGVQVVPPSVGRLAGGDEGAGRLADPDEIIAAVEAVFGSGQLAGVEVLITAGGTMEPIDPVRFIGNRSSGKQGYAIAAEAAAQGASVTLVTTVDRAAPAGAKIIRVETAAEMHEAVFANRERANVIVMAAAVADFRPREAAQVKLKKDAGAPAIDLEPTADILAELGASRPPGQVLVGFAAETEALAENAIAKLESKGADLIVANDVSADGVGFAHDTNAVTIFSPSGAITEVDLTSKSAIARAVLNQVSALLTAGEQDHP